MLDLTPQVFTSSRTTARPYPSDYIGTFKWGCLIIQVYRLFIRGKLVILHKSAQELSHARGDAGGGLPDMTFFGSLLILPSCSSNDDLSSSDYEVFAPQVVNLGL